MRMVPRLLLIFAHPDDESFIAAGLTRRVAEQGGTTTLITATRGEAGRVGDPPLCRREDLPAVREAELRRAAAILGIADLRLLDYRDRQVSGAPVDAMREALVRLIRRRRPHVVVTFDPNGMNGHPDHVAIGRFALDAAAAAADPRWAASGEAPHRVPRLLWNAPVPPWEVARSAEPGREPGVDFLIDVAPHRTARADALRAHRTQRVSIDRCFFSKPDADRILSVEAFRQAWGPVLPRVPADDVLAGLDLSA